MPWTSTKASAVTTYQFTRNRPVAWGLALLFNALTMGAAALAMFGVSAVDLRVRCDRMAGDKVASCKVTDGYLLGVVPVTRYAVGVGNARLERKPGSKGSVSHHLVLDSAQGPVVALPVYMGDGQEELPLLVELQAFFTGSETRFDGTVRLWGFGGFLFTPLLLIATFVGMILFALLGRLAPLLLEVDEARKVVRLRTRPLARVRELAFADVQALEVAPEMAQPTRKVDPVNAWLFRRMPRHLFVVTAARRWMLRNTWRLPELEVVRLRDELARTLGLKDVPPPQGEDAKADPKEPMHVRGLFTQIAGGYDRFNAVASLGLDRRWRTEAVRSAAIADGARVLDLAAGTGDLSLELANGARPKLVASTDFTPAMLVGGREKAQRQGAHERLAFSLADAQQLPFRAGAFDVVTVGFGLRNFADRAASYAEVLRVLRPGGRYVVLELTHPELASFKPLYWLYVRRILPVVGGWLAGNPAAYEYLHRTIQGFPDAPELAAELRAAGFAQVEWRKLSLGIVAIHVAVKGG